jgi:hypothetical protein
MPVQPGIRHLRRIFFYSRAWDEGRTARFLCQSNEEQSEVGNSDYESKSSNRTRIEPERNVAAFDQFSFRLPRFDWISFRVVRAHVQQAGTRSEESARLRSAMPRALPHHLENEAMRLAAIVHVIRSPMLPKHGMKNQSFAFV